MTYWRKKLEQKKIRCCGTLKNNERCKNMFYPKDDTCLTCHLHKEQKDATFWYASQVNQFKDVAIILARMIDDPKLFLSFAQVCRSTAKACHELQKEKIQRWKILCFYCPKTKPAKQYVLPNGSTVDENNEFINKCGTVNKYSQFKYRKYEIFKRVNGKKELLLE